MGIACYNSIGLFTDWVICALQRVKTEDKSSNLHLDQALQSFWCIITLIAEDCYRSNVTSA